jgi:Uma2 family endonuclease
MSEPGRDRQLTYADYAALPDDGRRYQLLDGELVMNPSPTRWHQAVSGELHSRLREHVVSRGLGEVFAAPLDVLLDERNVVQPDLLFVSNARREILRDANVAGAPDLCVEILSPGTERTDRLRKLDIYARAGVPHYWIVDPATGSIEEYVLHGDVFSVQSVTPRGELFRPAALPGFEFRMGTGYGPEK